MSAPELWWSESLGLVTHRDGVYWRYDLGITSLRHEGLPNELPADAVRLVPMRLVPMNRDENRLTVTVDHDEAVGEQP